MNLWCAFILEIRTSFPLSCVCVCLKKIYIYIYIYAYREREREREGVYVISLQKMQL